MEIHNTSFAPINAPAHLPKEEKQAAALGGQAISGSSEDTIELSPRAQALFAAAESVGGQGQTADAATELAAEADPIASEEAGEESDSSLDSEVELTDEEEQEVDKLKARDREVRAHEQAHLAAAGPYAKGGPTFEYQRGPDNKQYAVGGEVQIDTSKVADDPEATIRKAQVIRRAANAPAEPSSQDRHVAAQAAQMEAEARQELVEQQREELNGGEGGAKGSGGEDSVAAAPGAGEGAVVENVGGDVPEVDIDFSGTSGSSSASFVDRGGGDAGQLLDLIA